MKGKNMSESRIKNASMNFLSSTFGNLISTLMTFITRTVFIYLLGTSYLGINGLFTNVLGMLSFAELGIGTAINFSLYKPVAENDKRKISLSQ